MLKKLNEKEPFYATVYEHNVLKNKSIVKINKFTMGIELEVCYLIKKKFFNFKKKVTKNNIKRFISHIAPCIEVVGYRQKKKGIKSLGDLLLMPAIQYLLNKFLYYHHLSARQYQSNILN